LPRKELNVRAWERREAITLQKIENTLAVEIGYDAYVIPEVEAVAQMDALVAIISIVGSQCREDPEFDPTGITILLHRTNDFDGAPRPLSPVPCFDHLSKRPLA
jgi:hypothetical protein